MCAPLPFFSSVPCSFFAGVAHLTVRALVSLGVELRPRHHWRLHFLWVSMHGTASPQPDSVPALGPGTPPPQRAHRRGRSEPLSPAHRLAISCEGGKILQAGGGPSGWEGARGMAREPLLPFRAVVWACFWIATTRRGYTGIRTTNTPKRYGMVSLTKYRLSTRAFLPPVTRGDEVPSVRQASQFLSRPAIAW